MIRSFKRCISSKYFARTTLSPQNYKFHRPQTFQPVSLLVLATPNNLPQVIEESINAFQHDKLEVVVAGVDSVLNSNRDGVSELWLNESIQIEKSIPLEERDDVNTAPRESDGVNIVVARKNWKSIESKLSIGVGAGHNLDITLANTVFSTNNLVTLFYFNQGNEANVGKTLCELSIKLPEITTPDAATSSDKWVPLYASDSPDLIITDCIGNLVKAINSQSAAGYLESNEKLMSIKSKETEVYVKLYKQNQSPPQKFKVVAGGGGWGAKANIIVLSTQAKIDKGDRIEFFMLTPQDRYENVTVDPATLDHKFTIESSYEQLTYDDSTMPQQVLPNVFSCGSEQGFTYNGIRHASAGERLMISLA